MRFGRAAKRGVGSASGRFTSFSSRARRGGIEERAWCQVETTATACTSFLACYRTGLAWFLATSLMC